MKKIVLFSVLALTVSLCADDDLVAAAQKNGLSRQEKQEKKKEEKRLKEEREKMMNMVTLTSARPESDNGWYLFGDALYWHAEVGNADWAENTKSSATSTAYHTNHVNFKWNWGFKVGIGVNMDHDMWDSNLYYTWFETRKSNSVRRDTDDLVATQNVATFLPATGTANSARNKWSIHFSMFDWELGRWHYAGKSLALRPHVGLKGGWINQNRKSTAEVVDVLDEVRTQSGRFKNNFWGIGPSAGLNTMWILGNVGSNMEHRFSLFGDFAGALMYGHFNNTFSVSTTDSSTSKITNLSRSLAVPMLQAVMGLSWDAAFNRGRNHFMMKLGYEFQYWFRQNQYPSMDSLTGTATPGFLRYSDDLSLQGATLELRFDF